MFTDEEKELLSKYVTSTDANVFAVKGMEGMAGAAYARYSRAKGGFRETLLKEFIEEGVVDPVKAADLIERILIAYGDDSVGELEGAHVSFERMSILMTKEIQDRRIGGSPIEQSTRYVIYDVKDAHGYWPYYRGEEIVGKEYGELYLEVMDHLFELYTSLVEPLKDYLESQKPLEEAEYDINGDGVKEKLHELTNERQIKDFTRTYKFELRAKACDILRCLLPLSTLTNVGMYGNGRYYQHLISHLLTSEFQEARQIAEEAKVALGQIIPTYVRRAKRNDYLADIRNNMFDLVSTWNESQQARFEKTHIALENESVLVQRLLDSGLELSDALEQARDISTLALMIFPYSIQPLGQIRRRVMQMTQNERKVVISTYLGNRQSRRDRPGRGFEDGYPYNFELVIDFGVYKDLQRHRMASQQRQLFTARLGFTIPKELIALGVKGRVESALQKSEDLFEIMQKDSPFLAQYSVLHGHYVRWQLGINDRALMHMLELRTTPQGHPGYRKASQLMHELVVARSAWRGEAMKFVDYEDYYWSRADSEAKQRVKEARLDAAKL